MKMNVQGGYKGFDRRVQQFRRIPKKGKDWAERNAHLAAETYKENLSTQGRSGEGPPLADSTLERYERYGHPDGSAIYNHVRVVDESSFNRTLVAMEIPDEGDSPTPATLAKLHDRGGVVDGPGGGHIVIPGRRSWELMLDSVIPKARNELKHILKPTR